MDSYLVLLRVGFAIATPVASRAVRSYRTISPLPGGLSAARRYTFCCTFRGLTPPRSYLALCPVEPGLSSPQSRKRAGKRSPDRLGAQTTRRRAQEQVKLPSPTRRSCRLLFHLQQVIVELLFTQAAPIRHNRRRLFGRQLLCQPLQQCRHLDTHGLFALRLAGD
jgi:hypothetical protein